MSLYMESTKIDAKKTVGEIQELLAQADARKIMTEYKDGEIVAMNFTLFVDGREIPFSLPARVQPVFTYLQKHRSPKTRTQKAQNDLEQAVRVAWRQLLRWIQAQLALIETGMVEPAEVFMPYMRMGRETAWLRFKADGLKALPMHTEDDA